MNTLLNFKNTRCLVQSALTCDWSTGYTVVGDAGVDDSLSTYMNTNIKRHVTIVTTDQKTKLTLTEVAKSCNFEIIVVDTIPSLYPMFSDPSFKTDIIGIDIEALYDQEGCKSWDLVNTIDTLIKSTVCRSGAGKPTKRETHIAAGVSVSSSVEFIKDFLTLSDNIVGIFPVGEGFSLEEHATAFNEMKFGSRHIPKKIQELIKPKKCSCKSHAVIELTPRQEQILTLIKERGASNKTIARILNITESTVKLHVGLVLKKFGVKNRTQLALFGKK